METKSQGLPLAMFGAQSKMGPLKKDSDNPYFNSKYASLEAVLEVIKEPLFDSGLFVTQSIIGNELVTTVSTVEGEEKAYHYPLACKDPQSPQAMGAAVSYARRYSLMAIFGLAAEDDDGNVASQQKPTYVPPKQPANTPAATSPAQGNEFRFGFGKYSGKTLGEIPTPELQSWVKWARSQPKLGGPMKTALTSVDAYLQAADAFSAPPHTDEDIHF